jgi:SAM-dependent methyltransferase
MKKIAAILLASIAAIGAFSLYQQKNKQQIYTSQEASSIINDICAEVNGYSIGNEEREMIEKGGGNPTYGEITFDAVEELIKEFKEYLTAKNTFFDLGSGTGKVCVQVALRTPAKAIGVELSPTRCQAAENIKQELVKQKILNDTNKLQFFEQNILDADLSNAAVIFLCSTCFSEELMLKLSDKIAQLPKPVIVLTLKELPDPNNKFKLVKTFILPMTWSNNTNVYTYELL